MIRPFTVFCFLLACASGLYLYQTKHRMQMLDREIERSVHMADATRDQTRLLGAEWMLLNDPERLRALADQFLSLRTVMPAQFTTLADLDHRLPSVLSPDAPLEPVPEPDVMTPMVPPPAAPAAPPVAAAAPPVPQAQPTPHPAPSEQVAERRPPPHVAAMPAEPRPATAARGPLLAAAAPRPAPPPRFTPPIAPAVSVAQGSPVVQGGSALGMATRESLPPPKPISLFPPIDH